MKHQQRGFTLLEVTVALAIAAVLAQTVWSAALWFTALHRTGIDVSLMPRISELLAARRARGA